ncbi:MAG: glycoside hydrolase family 88 protein, partial [Spirochaetales bacterium]|nr:glycoside hydrolase family 88 protein [Spirochaetales bacterium]
MKVIDNYIEQMLQSTPNFPLWNQERIRANKKAGWNYIDGCMLTAFIKLYERKNDEKYLRFVKNYIDFFIEEDGNIKTYNKTDFNLDDINEGRILFTLYDIFGDEKYKNAMRLLYSQLEKQPRTIEGNFWHKKIYPNQVWLDGL